jgi:hypothetical protein
VALAVTADRRSLALLLGVGLTGFAAAGLLLLARGDLAP